MPLLPAWRIRKPTNLVDTADVIVYRDGDYAVAIDTKTRKVLARSTDHTEVIQKAIDYLTGNGGKIFLDGEFELNEYITLYSNMVIEGGGRDKTKLVQKADTDIFSVVNTENVTIKSMTLDTKTYNARACIGGRPVHNLHLEDLKLVCGDNTFCVYLSGPVGFEDDVEGNFEANNMSKGNKMINCEIYGEYTGDVLSWSIQSESMIINTRVYGRVALYFVRDSIFDIVVYGSKAQGIFITGPVRNIDGRFVVKGTTYDAVRTDSSYSIGVEKSILNIIAQNHGGDSLYLKNAKENRITLISYKAGRRGLNLVNAERNIIDAVIIDPNESNNTTGHGIATDGDYAKDNVVRAIVLDTRSTVQMRRPIREYATTNENNQFILYKYNNGVDGGPAVVDTDYFHAKIYDSLPSKGFTLPIIYYDGANYNLAIWDGSTWRKVQLS